MVTTRAGRNSMGGGGTSSTSADASSLSSSSSTKESTPSSKLYMISNLLLLAVLLGPSLYFLLSISETSFGPGHNARRYILVQLALACLGFAGSVHMINVMGDFCRRKKQIGRDLCKKGTPAGEIEIPESQGLSPGIIYLIIIISCQWFYAREPEALANYNSSLLSICFMLFLGFVDDVLDLPWRYKLVLPPIATLPLLCSYKGSTSFIIPKPLRFLLWRDGSITHLGSLISFFATVDAKAKGKLVELGVFFMIYMAMLAVFCTNAINIYAGINGLEAGQSLVIAVGIVAFKLYDIFYENDGQAGPTQVFSLTLVLPFIAVVLGLLYHNFYPARAFVGDTFCYFAGMTFAVIGDTFCHFAGTTFAVIGDTFYHSAEMTLAVIGIHGHFSKTLFLLFLPQVANFLLSLPQLFKIVPCPRHRLPHFDPTKGLLLPSICPCAPEQYVFAKVLFGLPRDRGYFINLTLINVALRLLGPTHERTLCIILLTLQAACCLLTLYLRFYLAHLFV